MASTGIDLVSVTLPAPTAAMIRRMNTNVPCIRRQIQRLSCRIPPRYSCARRTLLARALACTAADTAGSESSAREGGATDEDVGRYFHLDGSAVSYPAATSSLSVTNVADLTATDSPSRTCGAAEPGPTRVSISSDWIAGARWDAVFAALTAKPVSQGGASHLRRQVVARLTVEPDSMVDLHRLAQAGVVCCAASVSAIEVGFLGP